MTYKVRKVRTGVYALDSKEGTRYENIGSVYRMPYANMSRSWRAVLPPPHNANFDRPICSSKAEAIEVLKKLHETGSL